MEGSKCVLSFATEAYRASVNCQKELTYANQLKKPIIPVLVEDLDMSKRASKQTSAGQQRPLCVQRAHCLPAVHIHNPFWKSRGLVRHDYRLGEHGPDEWRGFR